MDIKKEFLEELQKMGKHKELPTVRDTVRVGTAIKAFNRIVNRLEARVKPASSGLLQYIPDKPIELPDNGAVQNEHGITASGVKVLDEWREILIKAGY